MMRRSLWVSLITVSGLVLASCGGQRLSREEFLQQGNQICSEGNARLDAAAEETFGDLTQDEKPSTEQLASFHTTLVSDVQGQIDDIAELKPPEELEADVDNLLQRAQGALDQVEQAGPQALLSEEDPFAEVNRLAGDIGLTECAEGGGEG
jgi:hypothetical protein